MAILSVAEFRGLAGGAGAASDQAIALSLDTAEERILRAHGMPGVNRRAVWQDRDGYDRYLGLPRRATALVSVSVDGTALAVDEYMLADGGWTIQRIGRTAWRENVTAVYTPFDYSDTRRQMQYHLALRALGYTGMGDQSIGQISIKPLGMPDAEDARILRMIPEPPFVADVLPDGDMED